MWKDQTRGIGLAPALPPPQSSSLSLAWQRGGSGANLELRHEMTGQSLKEVNPSSKEERRPQIFFFSEPAKCSDHMKPSLFISLFIFHRGLLFISP